MPTILTSHNRLATRRCDSTCHNAKHEKCACICGGRYHGKGTEAAQQQLTRDWLGDQCAVARAHAEADGGSLVIAANQMDLFDALVRS